MGHPEALKNRNYFKVFDITEYLQLVVEDVCDVCSICGTLPPGLL